MMINHMPETEEVFKKAYVDKETCRSVQVWPVPEDLENWYEIDFDPEFKYSGKIYIPSTGEWEEDLERYVGRMKALRKQAYMTESDPLFMEYQYDNTEESRVAWINSVNAIKERYPLTK